MGRFDVALEALLKTEGGYVDDHDDRGGPTNLGITLATWQTYFGHPGTPGDIESLTPELVAPIYRKLFWDQMKLDDLPYPVSEVLFDQTVLRGAGAIQTMQKVLGLPTDGHPGPVTFDAIKAHPNPKRLAFVFIRASLRDYALICQRSPSQLKFLSGWSDRLFALIERHLLGG